MSDATWNDEVSPYDVLGVGEDASNGDIRKAFFEQARLFHPDRNLISENSIEMEKRTAHFLKVKKAYEVLSSESSRKIYDACLLRREDLARKNLYKYAVSNTSEFRDIVDEQFKDAVLDPDQEIGSDALVLCCESCGAPSKFRCSICDMLTCAFCGLKPHASDEVPPHYPSKYSPSFKRKMEASERRKRLAKKQAERRAATVVLRAAQEKVQCDRRKHKRLAARFLKSQSTDQKEHDATLAKLSLGYAFAQTADLVYLAVWLPFATNDLDLELTTITDDTYTTRDAIVMRCVKAHKNSKDKNHLLTPVASGRPLYARLDHSVDVQCSAFPGNSVVVLRFVKAETGLRWPSVFADDPDGVRDAGDHDRHDWCLDEDDKINDDQRDPSTRFIQVDIQVPRGVQVQDIDVAISPKKLCITIPDWPSWWRRLRHTARLDATTWCLVEDDGKILVRVFLTLVNVPVRAVNETKFEATSNLDHIFVEDLDNKHTLAMTQLAIFLDYGEDRFMPRDALLPTARAALRGLELDHARSNRAASTVEVPKLPSLFQGQVPTQPNLRTWYARTLLKDEARWRDTYTALKKMEEPRHASVSTMSNDTLNDYLPAPPGARGVPTKLAEEMRQEKSVSLEYYRLFDDADHLGREDIVSFAWDGADTPIIEVYLSLGSLLDHDLTKEDVAVRFESRAILVHVKHRPNSHNAGPDALLCFYRHLYHSISPKKSSLKIVPAKGTIILRLRKKQPTIIWPSLARDVNALETTTTTLLDRSDQ